jgi:hypothetical protein
MFSISDFPTGPPLIEAMGEKNICLMKGSRIVVTDKPWKMRPFVGDASNSPVLRFRDFLVR